MKKAILFFFCFLAGLAIQAQSTLQFNQVLLISSASPQTVPAGKVWKVINAYAPSSAKFAASSGSGTCSGTCNGSSTQWTNFTISYPGCPASSDPQIKIGGNAVSYNSSSPLWLPAGTTVQGNILPCSNPSNGYFTGQGYSCYCPPSTVSFTISVIEFNVIP